MDETFYVLKKYISYTHTEEKKERKKKSNNRKTNEMKDMYNRNENIR